MASIAVAKDLVALCRRAEISLFLWGAHGLGKSSLVHQVARDANIGFVDLRCAQMDAVDLRGLPDRGSDGRTHFLPPAELPVEGEGILFLDELNRASTEVVAALFQLVLERRIGQYILPAGWSIVAAGNFAGGQYDVNELDPAFSDRFCHAVVSSGRPTFDEWAKWMMETHGESAYRAVNFCSVNHRNLEAECEDQLPFTVQPSRRSWDAAVRGMQVVDAGEYCEETVGAFLAGLLGMEISVSFMNHKPTVHPTDILKLGMRRMRIPLRRCGRGELSAIVTGMKPEIDAALLDEKLRKNLFDFLDFLSVEHPDLAIALCTSALGLDPDYQELRNKAALITNVRLSRRLASIEPDEPSFLSELLKRADLLDRLGDMLCGVH